MVFRKLYIHMQKDEIEHLQHSEKLTWNELMT